MNSGRRTERDHVRICPEGKPNAAAPRPSRCDLEECAQNIAPTQHYFVDRVWPLISEVPTMVGVMYVEKVANFCSENCRERHRSAIFALRTRRPSP